jgi:hypothetical protein
MGPNREWGEMDFQVHEQTYFLSLAEDEKQWEVFVDTPDGPRAVPVYVDAPKLGPIVVLQEERHRMPN